MQGPLLKCCRLDSLFEQTAQEAENLSDSDDLVEDIDEDIDLGRNLGDCQVILVTGISTTEYAQTVAKVQEMGLPVRQDNMPFDPESSTVAIVIPEGEVEELAAHITPLWTGPSRILVGLFVPALEKTKIAVRAAKGVAVRVDLKSIIDYIAIHGIAIMPHQALLVMVVPGTWQLLVEDRAVTKAVCTLSSILVLGKELTVSPWLNIFSSGARHQVYMQNLAVASSRTALVSFFTAKCGMVINSHFGKLPDQRYAPWMLIEFASAVSLCNALALSSTKRFNGKIISVVRAKSAEEREAEVKIRAAEQRKRANRSAETQARQLRQAERRDRNNAAIAEYAQLAEAAAAGFNPVI